MGSGGRKSFLSMGCPFGKSEFFSVLSPAHPLALPSCICLIKVENVTVRLSIAYCLRSTQFDYILQVGVHALSPSNHIAVMCTRAQRVPPGQN